ncbi:unnamed protein product [Trichobilharzia regenti]|nr:unnamed protein product [Trichobilharzia regenti]
MRALETQLRNQLENLQRDDRLNRLSLSNQRQENEALSSRISKLTNRCRNEKANLNNVEQSLNEEIRLRQLVEAQLTEMNVIPVCNISKTNSNISSSSSTEQSTPTSVAAIQINPFYGFFNAIFHKPAKNNQYLINNFRGVLKL